MMQASDEDDYKKLAKVMQYLHGSCKLTLTIELGEPAWVESSYAILNAIKKLRGIFMTLAEGATYSASSNQK